MEKFYCKISDPTFSRYIDYTREKCDTIEDIKHLISYVLQINKSQFVINNPPKSNPIRSIIKNYEFQITITMILTFDSTMVKSIKSLMAIK